MPKILVLYGTTEGQTAKIARAIADTLTANHMEADVIEAGPGAPDATHYDGVVIAASVHAGRFQKPVYRWAAANTAELNIRPTAFVSVCLGVLQKDPKVQQEVTAIAERFLTAVKWQPTMVKTVAGALAYSQYNFLVRLFMKRIARKAGGDTDTSRDYEYTDWNDLRTFATQFGQQVGHGATTGPASDQPSTQ